MITVLYMFEIHFFLTPKKSTQDPAKLMQQQNRVNPQRKPQKNPRQTFESTKDFIDQLLKYP